MSTIPNPELSTTDAVVKAKPKDIQMALDIARGKNSNVVAMKTDDFLTATEIRTVSGMNLNPVPARPVLKMFPEPIGGEVIMPTGEILKVTCFYPPETVPARAGVYATREDLSEDPNTPDWEIGFSFFNGSDWGPQFTTPESAEENAKAASYKMGREWAGLSEEHPDNQI